MRKLLLPLLTQLAFAALAQETPSPADRIFQLGEVRVSGIGDRDSIASRLSYRTIEQFNRNDLSNALNILPGVSIANVGPRNESVVYVRGFDLRQVPVYIDGVPVYVPYDGYVDMGRFTTVFFKAISTTSSSRWITSSRAVSNYRTQEKPVFTAQRPVLITRSSTA